ncbi:peptidase S58 DmpA [Acetobacter nitrogenifigens DSM 23921 = NBRC 105050]|uniref:Peptidase T4 n=1 Tax=Acetobacter nitrogenifigens DSM 23921 = NBRC 105050 TaxID=1120919 RepID=A0A511XDT1_9PROT|nr:P1 family peptidase [Acetobacter nitrogenifigens]GBQ96829.1 peptidase S58 DmpA [Acetobacter nitrogenifigens DSM 23921 = NBRC 105050]GEN61107.1 peptidase T4 [Acetobacter nitrogenifigens DSM 23921 = NBRC 105050]
MKRRALIASAAALPLLARASARAAVSGHSFGPGRPGPLNLITDVAGLRVGQAQDSKARSGVTVILPDGRASAAVDVRGGGPGTRETDALDGWNLVRSVDAIVLSGGSVYGLAAADGVAAWLGAHGRGFSLMKQPGVPPSPIVPTAILFDLANGGDKNWGMTPPYHDLAIDAVEHVSDRFSLGTAGAGYGAGAGALKGGLGSASLLTGDGMTIGAIVGVNSLGSAVVPGTRNFWSGPFEFGQEFGGLGASSARVAGEDWGEAKINPGARANTTIACVATDMALDPDELKRVAMMAQDGLARAIRPIHSPFDGDVVFALSTAKKPLPAGPRQFLVARIGAAAADVLARAVARGVFEATLPPGMQGLTWRTLTAKP